LYSQHDAEERRELHVTPSHDVAPDAVSDPCEREVPR
jgi:hypothetical protein